jgi:ABC-type uncharacterized transport system ATPase subunit
VPAGCACSDNAASTSRRAAVFGRPLPARDGTLMVELEHGSSDVGPIVVALNEEGLSVEHLDVVQPTLDDVFVQKTGQHLEGAEEDETEAVAE